MLPPKRKRFVEEYLIDLNATRAADRVGYKKPNVQGARLLANVSIQEEISKAIAERAKRSEITADYVLKNLQSIVERCMQAEEVYDRDGNPTGEYRFDSSGANKALELLGKHLKLFTEKKELTLPEGVKFVIED